MAFESLICEKGLRLNFQKCLNFFFKTESTNFLCNIKKIWSKFKFEQYLALFLLMTSQNISLFMIRHYFIVIEFLPYQSGLDLVWCLLNGLDHFVTERRHISKIVSKNV